ncbi:hypothetical protein RB601_000633 [Gaeumannomyces tritici]
MPLSSITLDLAFSSSQQVTMADDGLGAINVLYEPDHHDFDVVAIHGLNGDYLKSWTHADSTLWLRDMLPGKLAGARVMSFSYDASTSGGVVYAVREIAKQLLSELRDAREDAGSEGTPIVFVCHSLGGIVLKQALALADDGKAYSDVAESTKGIVFFGTPHRGSNVANFMGTVSDIVQAVTARPESKLLHALESNSTDLYKVSTDFRPLASRYAITSFYESNEHPVLRKMVVGKMSAVMGLPNEEDVMMNGDHSTICKFGKGDRRFNSAWRAIKRMEKGVQS